MLILVRLGIVPGSCRRPHNADWSLEGSGELVRSALVCLLQRVGGEEWATGTLDSIVDGEKDISQLLLFEKMLLCVLE